MKLEKTGRWIREADTMDPEDTLAPIEVDDLELLYNPHAINSRAMVVYSVPKRNVRVLICTCVPEGWREAIVEAGLPEQLADESFEDVPEETRLAAWRIFAEKKMRGAGVIVRVRSNIHFVRGEEIIARPDPANPNAFSLDERYPRYQESFERGGVRHT